MPGEDELLQRLAALEGELQALREGAPRSAPSVVEQIRRQEGLNLKALHQSPSTHVKTQTLATAMQTLRVDVSTARRAMAIYRLRSGYWPNPQRMTVQEAAILQRDAKALMSAQPLLDWPPATPTEEVFAQLRQESRLLSHLLEEAEGLLAQLLRQIPWALRAFWEQRHGALRERK